MHSSKHGWRRDWHGFAAAFLIGGALLSFAVGRPALLIGLFCVLSGLVLLLRPRLKKLGAWLDTCLLAVIVLPWLALLPASWIPFQAWRQEAIEAVALPFGFALALSLQRVWEVWLFIVAAVGWLYFMRARPLNSKTRPILCMLIAWLGAAWACWFLFIRLMHHATNPSAGLGLLGSPAVSALIMAACGLVAYGITLDGVRHRMATRMAAAMPLMIISIAMVFMQSIVAFIALAAGVLIWTVSRLICSPESRNTRVFLFAFSVLILHGGLALEGLRGVFHTVEKLLPEASLAVFALQESPILGLGAGQAGSWETWQRQMEDGFVGTGFALGTEFGWLGWVLFAALAIGFMLKLRKHGVRVDSGFRFLAFIAAAICALGIILFDGHRNPVLLYLIITLLVLTLGHSGRFEGHFFAERPVQLSAWGLIVIGCIYLFGFATALPLTHSAQLAAQRGAAGALVDKTDIASGDLYISHLNAWSRLDPLNAMPYQRRAIHELKTMADAGSAGLDFRRARFLTNNNLSVLRLEAETWSRHLPAQSIEAWSRYLNRAQAADVETFSEAFATLLEFTNSNSLLTELARDYGHEHAHLRHQYIVKLPDETFYSEIEQAFQDGSLGAASESALRQLAVEAARRNGFDIAERIAKRMDANNVIGRDTRLAIQFQRGDLVASLRTALDNFRPADAPPAIDIEEVGGQEEQLLRLTRSNSPQRLEIAYSLLALYIETDQISRGRQLLRQLMREGNAPEYGLQWLAEVHYRQGDYVESWEVLRHQFPYLDIQFQ